MAVLRTILFMLIFYPASAFIVLMSPIASALGRPAQIRWTYVWIHIHNWATRVVLGIRYRVEGQVPPGPVLVAMKHEAMYETLQAFLFLDRPCPVFKRELTRIPLWGRVTRVYGSVVVDRDGGARALRTLLAEARTLIAEGRPILIFPEGTRVPHGSRPPVKPGISGLYRMLGLPVVPVAVDSGRLWPRGRFARHAGLVTFRVGEMIPPGLPREEMEARLVAAINALNPSPGAGAGVSAG